MVDSLRFCRWLLHASAYRLAAVLSVVLPRHLMGVEPGFLFIFADMLILLCSIFRALSFPLTHPFPLLLSS